jgi:NAD(P)-dependent dehydrogenase (short-subunit alcohol dehydrogenase family)
MSTSDPTRRSPVFNRARRCSPTLFSNEELKQLAELGRQENLPIRGIRLDATSPQDWGDAAEQIGTEFRRLDIMVNDAGMMDSRSFFFDTELEDFRKTMRVNMESMFIGAKAMVTLLRRGGEGNPNGASSINICSIYGEVVGSWNVAFEQRARELVLTLPQCKVLLYLATHEGVSQ